MSQANEENNKKGALRGDQNKLMFGQGFSFSGYERDPLYLNLGTKKFMDISGISGIDSISDGRAGVFADFDNDGDLDVFATAIQGQSHLLFRNNVGQDNNFLRIMIEGKTQSDAFGAVVRLKTSAGIQTKIHSGGSGFISQNDPRLLFGLGQDEKAEWVEVTWTNGKPELFTGNLSAGGNLLLQEGIGKAATVKLEKSNLPEPLTKTETFAKGLKLRVGQKMSDFMVKTLNGESSALKKHFKAGRSTLVNIWATWCIPCAKEMPELEKMKATLAARGIDLIGINVDLEKNAPIVKYIKGKNITYPILIGGVPAIESIYATDELSVPLSILVDENGFVRELIPGWSAETQRKFTELTGEKTIK